MKTPLYSTTLSFARSLTTWNSSLTFSGTQGTEIIFFCKARVKGVTGHQHHCSCILGVTLRATQASRSRWLATQAKKWRADWTVWKPVYNHVVTFTRCHAKGIKELCKEVCCVGTICVECRCNVTKYGRKTNNRAVVVT